MFFVLSKLLWALVAPVNLLALILFAGVVLLYTRFARSGRRLVVLAAAGFFIFGVLPVGVFMLRVLEIAFPAPRRHARAGGDHRAGGGVNELVTRFRGPVELSGSGERMTEAAMLARRFPQAKLVFTGGSAAVFGVPIRGGHRAPALPRSRPAARASCSRTESGTHGERGLHPRLVQPKPGEIWLLVTSACHMPRSVGSFRKAGFPVTPFPVNYATLGVSADYALFPPDVSSGLGSTGRALREYIGLLAYWLAGKTDALFPGP